MFIPAAQTLHDIRRAEEGKIQYLDASATVERQRLIPLSSFVELGSKWKSQSNVGKCRTLAVAADYGIYSQMDNSNVVLS